MTVDMNKMELSYQEYDQTTNKANIFKHKPKIKRRSDLSNKFVCESDYCNNLTVCVTLYSPNDEAEIIDWTPETSKYFSDRLNQNFANFLIITKKFKVPRRLSLYILQTYFNGN